MRQHCVRSQELVSASFSVSASSRIPADKPLASPLRSGSIGNVCSVTNGVAGCSSGSCTIASCNVGYTLSSSSYLFGLLGSSQSCVAVNTATDVNNCGAVGRVCTFPNGAGTCSSGTCSTTSCNSGFYLVGGQCVTLNLQTDVNNCGSVGNKCSVSNGVAQCSSGSCSIGSCNTGYTLTTTGSLLGLFGSSQSCMAVNTASDVNNWCVPISALRLTSGELPADLAHPPPWTFANLAARSATSARSSTARVPARRVCAPTRRATAASTTSTTSARRSTCRATSTIAAASARSARTPTVSRSACRARARSRRATPATR